jgi:hypothetical protein
MNRNSYSIRPLTFSNHLAANLLVSIVCCSCFVFVGSSVLGGSGQKSRIGDGGQIQLLGVCELDQETEFYQSTTAVKSSYSKKSTFECIHVYQTKHLELGYQAFCQPGN